MFADEPSPAVLIEIPVTLLLEYAVQHPMGPPPKAPPLTPPVTKAEARLAIAGSTPSASSPLVVTRLKNLTPRNKVATVTSAAKK